MTVDLFPSPQKSFCWCKKCFPFNEKNQQSLYIHEMGKYKYPLHDMRDRNE